MSYFWSEFLRWKKYWGTTLFAASLALAVIDFVRPDRYFNRIFFKTWLAFWLIALTSIALKNTLKPYWQKWLLFIEKRRKKTIGQILEDNPQFRTLCCECRYYNHRLELCSRQRSNKRVKWIKMHGYDRYDYCLYWQSY
jgi:hypothetical protein